MTLTYLKKIFPMTWREHYVMPTYEITFDTSSPYITNTITPFDVLKDTQAVRYTNTPNTVTVGSADYTMQLADEMTHITWWAANGTNMGNWTPITISSDTTFVPTIQHYHRDTQWPCPNGFHIGTQTEWDTLKTALETLWVWNKTDFMNYLKVPSAYYLNRTNGAKNTTYWPVRFWTSTMTSNTVAYCMYVNEKDALAVASDKPGNAFSIRPFRDEAIVPDSTWTLLTTGIYWNSTKWLISITWDGWTTYITISDKNLWATNVWDDWLYYQFWNNYWFSVSPSSYVTSKPTLTSTYGPGNYYNSSTFVRVSKGNNWFEWTVNNIWWWVSDGTWTE